jgi:hypothetical protein
VPLLREIFDYGGYVAWPFAVLAGSVSMVTVSAFFKENWQFALACAAAFGYYGFGLLERVLDRWRREDLRHIVSMAPQLPIITPMGDGSFTVVANFFIVNNADYKIMFVIDSEDYSIKGHHSEDKPINICQFIHGKGIFAARTNPISSVRPEDGSAIIYKFTARIGKDEKNLNIRWFFEAEGWLPPPINTGQPRFGAYRPIRDQFETILG